MIFFVKMNLNKFELVQAQNIPFITTARLPPPPKGCRRCQKAAAAASTRLPPQGCGRRIVLIFRRRVKMSVNMGAPEILYKQV
jgi:hypothetical protein